MEANDLKESGITIFIMGLEKKVGLMALGMKVILPRARRMDKEPMFGPMVHLTLEIG